MIKSVFQKLLFSFGKTYKIDNNIPKSFFRKVMVKRFLMILRGLFFYRKKVFLGRKVQLLHRKNIFLGKHSTIENNTIIDGYCSGKLIIGDFSKIGAYSEIRCTSHFSKYGKGFELGNNSGIGKFAFFGASGGLKIGSDVIIGEYVSFHSENHNFKKKDELIRNQGVTSKGIEIGNNVWVGAKVTFLDGTNIKDGCVVAAGAVVKGDFPPNVVIGGVPAKIIKNIE